MKKDLSKNLLLKWFCDVNKLQLPRFFVINPKRLCILNTFGTLWYFFTDYHDRCIDYTGHFYRGKWPSNRGKLVRCVWPDLPEIMYLSMLCRRGGRGGGAGHGVGIWLCPGVGHLNDLVHPGEGIFESWRYLTADSDEKDWDRTYVSVFHASRMRRTVWKDLEWVDFTILSSHFICFSVFLINWTS